MNKILILCLLLMVSCDRTHKEYYQDGTLYKDYRLKNNFYDGLYKEYYQDGGLKVIHKYLQGKNIDTSFYYDKKSILREKRIWLDSLKNKVILFDNDHKTAQGFIINDTLKINDWTYFKNEKDSIVEYVIVDNTSHANQFWIKNKRGDTLWNESNDYQIYLSKNKVRLNEIVRVRLVLMDPYLNNLSDVKVLLFKDNNKSNKNFYDYKGVKKDTFLSLKNDGIPHPEVPKDVLQNHIVEFGLKFKTTGSKKIKGVLREYSKGYFKDQPNKVENFTNDLFFEKEITVIDSLDDNSL